MSPIVNQPSKEDRRIADKSAALLTASLAKHTGNTIEIEIEETGEKIKVPISAMNLLVQILSKMKEGKPFSLVPVSAEMTTQAAAEFLNCSRPHIVKLLEEGKIPFTMVGRHRRILIEDLKRFKQSMKDHTRQHLITMMRDAEELGLYDS